ncbi:hypothetical protein AB0N61_11110 [Microbacterium sp. NPDC089320]|uniref:hypothetical protein n=1 Tax=Microbacterium sp. NPDC089320 TaxID=3155182 RepID=UPI00342660FC
MTLPEQAQTNRAWHVVGLVSGVLAIVSLWLVPNGIVGYLIAIAIAVAAVLIGHAAVRRRGAYRAAAIVGLILAYLELFVAAALALTWVMRVFSR